VQDRDLIVGVLAAQAGFVTPAQVLTAAASGLVDAQLDSMLTRLEQTGALGMEHRRILEALAEAALKARNGDARAVAASVGGEELLETLLSTTGAPAPALDAPRSATPEVPLERPGQYTRLREVGRGSQSVVRAARDEIVGRDVALKELAPVAERASDKKISSRAARVRFLREVRLIAGLDHPGIVAIHELARREDGTLFCAEKLIHGETLQARLACCGSLEERLRLLKHVVDACQAVAYAHAKHIIHRDLKPSNVMVGEYGETVVVDWGLAKHREEAEGLVPLPDSGASGSEPSLTVAGVALGTPGYMSPEQARGDLAAIDARSDVFSLGAILYQVLTGRPPFEGATAEHIMENVRAGKFAPILALVPQAPPELAAIAKRALRPQPADRYEDAAALAQELSTFLAGGKVRAYQYGGWQLLQKFVSSHRALSTGLAVAIGALLVSAVMVGFRLHAARLALASSFIERAYTAEREGDWAHAAAYFAAAREQHDTPEARWGVALAGERATERILSLHAQPGSFTDVGVLSDGRVVALGIAPNRVEVRDVESGKTLWSHTTDRMRTAALLPGGQVRLSVPGGLAFYEAATGNPLRIFDRAIDGQACPGPYPAPASTLRGQLIVQMDGGPRALASDVSAAERCAVSEDGRQVAYQDVSETIHLLSVGDGRSLASASSLELRSMWFSRHGLVLIKVGRLEVIGGPDGNFTIELPEAGFGGGVPITFGGEAVSPDGHLVVVARLGSNRADVIDLRTRSFRGTLHYAPGWPRFAFSLDGQRVFAAGLGEGAQLSGWHLSPEDIPTTHPGAWWDWQVTFSSSGSRFMVLDSAKHRFEIYGRGGEFLESGVVPEELSGKLFVGDGPGFVFLEPGGEITFHDPQRGRVAWKHPCQRCSALGFSEDGSRVVQLGLGGLQVWDIRADRLVFAEAKRVGGFKEPSALSPDGRRVVWTQGVTAILRDLDSGQERTFSLDGVTRGLRFSPESARLVIATTGSIALWDAATGRLLWRVANASPDVMHEVRWSADGGALLLQYMTLGSDVLDANQGKRLARFLSAGAVSPVVPFVQPDLRAKVVVTGSHWEHRPLPQAATESPALSLSRTLARTGLAFQGVDLVAAP